jgi:uncharacterized protein (DUF1800 family)
MLSKNVKHLLFRAGFGPGPNELKAFQGKNENEVVEFLFSQSTYRGSLPITFSDPMVSRPSFFKMSEEEKLDLKKTDESNLNDLRDVWVYEMANNWKQGLHEKMTLFWHTHFACQCKSSNVAKSYLETLRKHALGNFKDLALAVAKEPAMIRFLNNQQNQKNSPNENFARELLELFTMGEGNYSEEDIKESARAFTGWSSNLEGEFVFRPRMHDYGEKKFMGKKGRFDGTDIIKLITRKKQTAYFIASKVYQFFVNDQKDEDRIKGMADVLYNSRYDIKAMMRYLFKSEWFYEERHFGQKTKSPIELLVHLIKLFDFDFTHDRALHFLQRALGQILFNPPNVAGWPSGAGWINNATIMLRLNLPAFIVNQQRFDHSTKTPLKALLPNKAIQTLEVKYNLSPIKDLFNRYPFAELEHRVKSALLAAQKIPDLRGSRDKMDASLLHTLIIRAVSLPEFQVC